MFTGLELLALAGLAWKLTAILGTIGLVRYWNRTRRLNRYI